MINYGKEKLHMETPQEMAAKIRQLFSEYCAFVSAIKQITI